jgi:hypothetical protein
MGQYYKPVNLDTNENLYGHEYDNGLKLMEHSYIGNNFVGAVENLLMPKNKWHKSPIVWAGDYADPELDEQGNPLVEKQEDGNKYELNIYSLSGGEYSVNGKVGKKLKPKKTNVPKAFKYIVNHTKKVYVNKDNVPHISWDDNMYIHPLPLLTCEGNGRGSGDYHDESPLIGSWARNVISVEKKVPEGYKEIDFNLTEEGQG